jgi:uncharacterized metal-binding protein YceD (DUF177 family)
VAVFQAIHYICNPFLKRSLKPQQSYELQFIGLKEGKHEMDWSIGYDLFEDRQAEEIIDTHLLTHLSIEKKERLMNLYFEIDGTVKVNCDRCGESFDFQLSTENELVVRFANETDFSDDDVIFLDDSKYKVDLSQHLYEFVMTALPRRRIHDDGECNEEVLNLLDGEEEETNENEIDPRWEALKKLKN